MVPFSFSLSGIAILRALLVVAHAVHTIYSKSPSNTAALDFDRLKTLFQVFIL